MRTKLLVILFFSLITAYSQNSSKYSNEFLNIGVDATVEDIAANYETIVDMSALKPRGMLQLNSM